VAVLAAAILAFGGCGSMGPPLEVVDFVDLEQYAGRWYEIARIPNSFERDCVGVTADYTLRDDGQVDVLNTCVEGDLEGEVRTIEGVARVVDPDTNAKLAVRFFGPFEGAYWIIELGDTYEYAVVGNPTRSFLWILSRTPELDDVLLEDIISRLPERGYDPQQLEMVPQASAE
jgi:apolipoprotein D and lipocalin family protein